MKDQIKIAAICGVTAGCILSAPVVSTLTKWYVTDELTHQFRLAHIEEMNAEARKYNDKISELRQEAYDLKQRVAELEMTVEELQDSLQRHSDEMQYKMADMVITAYSPYENVSGIENDGDADTTSTGMRPGPTVFAVDPKVIPYYSKMIIIYEDGEIIQGIAGDTGGAIKNNRVDVFKHTYSETISHGRRNATVIWWQ